MKSAATPVKRTTRQKSGIMEVLCEAPGPMSVLEIHAAAQKRVPGLGIATVYRLIASFVRQGSVRTFRMPSGDIRYENVEGRPEHHHHFFCRVCQRAFDLTIPCPVEHLVELPRGFRVESHEFTLMGLCELCGGASST
ncbi:MAG TPA: transcriptional repressor [Fibrobacteraceae bacterium]|nr:transcriptional repressor [Fibrobacteraceae bacterium]